MHAERGRIALARAPRLALVVLAVLAGTARAQDTLGVASRVPPIRVFGMLGAGLGTHAFAGLASAQVSIGKLVLSTRSLEHGNLASDGVRDGGVLAGYTGRSAGRERHLMIGIVEAQRHRPCDCGFSGVEPVFDRERVFGFSVGERSTGRVVATGLEIAGSIGPRETSAIAVMFSLSLGRL